MMFASSLRRRAGAVLLHGLAAAAATPGVAHACSSEPYLSEICVTALSSCPKNYMQAAGQILRISLFKPLYAVIVNTFGGDGSTTFALPNLTHLSVIGTGANKSFGGDPVKYGAVVGAAMTQIKLQNMPTHVHQINQTAEVYLQQASIPFNTAAASSLPAPNISPGATVYPANAQAGSALKGVYTTTSPNPGPETYIPAAGTFSVAISGGTQNTGDGQPISTQTPVLPLTYCIAVEGALPPKPPAP